MGSVLMTPIHFQRRSAMNEHHSLFARASDERQLNYLFVCQTALGGRQRCVNQICRKSADG